MPKGVAWSNEETKQLLDLRHAGKTISEIAFKMHKSEQSVQKKLQRLGLKVVHPEDSNETTTSLIVPQELPSIEEALKTLVAAMKILEKPGISKIEILRAKNLIHAAGAYQGHLANYINYCKIERDLMNLKEKLDQMKPKDAGPGDNANKGPSLPSDKNSAVRRRNVAKHETKQSKRASLRKP